MYSSQFAIRFPPNATLTIDGGRISQIEKLSIYYGAGINIKNAIIDSISKHAFMLQGVRFFHLENNTIAQIYEKAFVSNHLDNR